MLTILQYLEKFIKSKWLSVIFFLLLINKVNYSQTASFTYSVKATCAPTIVIFVNTSSEAPGTQYLWDFGKGAVILSSKKTLQEVYSTPGVYKVTLKVINGTDTVKTSKDINIPKGPKASYKINRTTGCTSTNFTFTNNSLAGDSPIQQIYWDFRNGIILNGNTANYKFSQNGTYNLLFQIVDQNGCFDYIESDSLIEIIDGPKADFTVTDSFSCEPPLAAGFINKSTGQRPLQYHWDYGNGSTSDNFAGSTVYNSSGIFNVALKVTDGNGCEDTLIRKNLVRVGTKEGEIYAQSAYGTYTEPKSILCPGFIIFGTTLSFNTDYHWTVKHNSTVHTFSGSNRIQMNFADSGIIEVKLVYGLATACPDSMTNIFRVEWIKAGFTMDKSYTCQLPDSLKLKNTTENASMVTWLYPGGYAYNAIELSIKLNTPETYKEIYNHQLNSSNFNIILLAESPSGCLDTAINSLNISKPTARFMPDVSLGCVPFKVSLSDSSKSVEPITKRTYIINNQTYIKNDATELQYNITQPGNYNATLIIENSAGCIDTSYSVTIHAGRNSKPALNVIPGEICFGDPVQLTGSSAYADSIDLWEFSSPELFHTASNSNSTAIQSVRPDSPGAFDILLTTNYNGCISDTLYEDLLVVKGPVGNFSENFSCDNSLQYKFKSEFQEAEILEWNIDGNLFNNLDSLTYTFANRGDFAVKLKASSASTGCSATYIDTIKVRIVEARYIVESSTVCIGDKVIFDAKASKDYINECYREAFLWDFDDETPQKRNYLTYEPHIFADTGTYNVTLEVTAENGCKDTVQSNIFVVAPEIAIHSDPDSGCSPLTVNLTAEDFGETVTNWRWSYGDGNIDADALPNVSYVYDDDRERFYKIGLTANDFYGCKKTVYKDIKIHVPSLEIQAEKNRICLGEEVKFQIDGNQPSSYQWVFGDGDTSVTSSNHTYTNTGTYDISFNAISDGCGVFRYLDNYIVVEEADASYMVSDTFSACYPAIIDFSYAGTKSNPATGSWYFEPGVQSDNFSTGYSYTYLKPGTYETSLRIRTLNNCMDEKKKTITIEGPYAYYNFYPDIICSGDQVNFSLDSLENTDTFYWIFGDGTTSIKQKPQHIYYAKGTILPIIHLKKGDCEVDLGEKYLNVSTLTSDFSIIPAKSQYCQSEPFQLINESESNLSSIWYSGSLLLSTSNDSVPVTPVNTGNMDLTLIVSDEKGCTDTSKKQITVYEVPELTITGNSVICPGIANPISANISAGSTIQWTPSPLFSDPNSTNTNVTTGTSTTIFATATNTFNCSTTKGLNLLLKDIPLITQSPTHDTTIYLGETIQLNITGNTNNLTYSWEPDDYISCTDCSNPQVSPQSDVTYSVKVSDGCYELGYEFPIHVLVDFYIELPTAFTPNGDGENDIYHAEVKNVSSFEFKIFNRWGELVFSTNNNSEGWDGMVNGKIQNADSYVYHIHAESEHGYTIDKKGTFLLIR